MKYKGNEAVELGKSSVDEDVLDPASRWYMYEYRREVSARYHFPPGVYCIIPTTFAEGGQAPYMLRICTEKPVESRYGIIHDIGDGRTGAARHYGHIS